MVDNIPEAGDIIRLYIGPSKGNEQDGYRAVLVISPLEVNELTGRVFIAPITSTVRGWETEIPIASLKRSGVALIDQTRWLSYTARQFKFDGEQASDEELAAAKYAHRMLLDL
jgi:mRNA interferase MazF